ncbi:hypothetical protein FB451DRAFT_1402545 [Mycena latifolia]|nr:hypothetical protein FB451DRAFT_1402545 [Mycena latifolia]
MSSAPSAFFPLPRPQLAPPIPPVSSAPLSTRPAALPTLLLHCHPPRDAPLPPILKPQRLTSSRAFPYTPLSSALPSRVPLHRPRISPSRIPPSPSRSPPISLKLEGNTVEGVLALKMPWPPIAHTIWQDHAQYLETHMKAYPRLFYTAMAPRVARTDVINVSGHRLSMAETESALIMHKGVAETAVIVMAGELTRQAVYALMTLKPRVARSPSSHCIRATAEAALHRIPVRYEHPV